MTENTLVKVTPATQNYSNPIAVRFFENLEYISQQIKETGTTTFSSIESILGTPPTPADSPDLDTMQEYWDEISKYSDKCLDIDSKLRTYAK